MLLYGWMNIKASTKDLTSVSFRKKNCRGGGRNTSHHFVLYVESFRGSGGRSPRKIFGFVIGEVLPKPLLKVTDFIHFQYLSITGEWTSFKR